MISRSAALTAVMFLLSFSLVLFELALTRVFAVVLFASFAHLALALALLGISAGALAQHLRPSLVPEEGLEARVATLALLQGGSTILAVLLALVLPITVQFAEPPVTFGERSSVYLDLIDPLWFSVLLPFLALPFAFAGLAFGGVFQRRKSNIGQLYGADLIGGAAGALVFVPLLYVVSGPDAAFVIALATTVAATLLFVSVRHESGMRLSAGLSLALSGVVMLSFSQPVFQVRFSAGYSEENVTWTRWTPLTRLALHEDDRGIYMLLDNTSASEVVTTRKAQKHKAREAARSLVYRLHTPPARIAIMAASAGPEVAVAQLFGYENIDAIDIAPEIGDAVATRFPDATINPYVQGNTRRILLDGRAAILHADQPYDIIQMVHANLHSSAGLLSNAWSPALLETKEAFGTYFDQLTPDGTLSFGRGYSTNQVGRAVAAALRARGVTEPAKHILLVRGNSNVLLAKKRPFTVEERDRVKAWIDAQPNLTIVHDPIDIDMAIYRKEIARSPLLTDAHPYFDQPDTMAAGLGRGFKRMIRDVEGTAPPSEVLYHTLAWQILGVLLCGLGLVALPWFRRSTTTPVTGRTPVLLYMACLGYGYLAVETVLIHELVLFVGHPTYAITVVILAMLLMSGLGSIYVGKLREDRVKVTLIVALIAILLLGALQAWVVPGLLHATALGTPLFFRAMLTFVALAPLGLVMGVPFPAALRLLRPEADGLVPWAWALNGWMSVVASLSTVLISRAWGYPTAFTVALVAYGLALALVHRIPRAGVAMESSAAA